MSYYPKPDSHIRNKVKVVLGLSNYATKPYTSGLVTTTVFSTKISEVENKTRYS